MSSWNLVEDLAQVRAEGGGGDVARARRSISSTRRMRPGAWRHDDDAVGQVDRLVDVVVMKITVRRSACPRAAARPA